MKKFILHVFCFTFFISCNSKHQTIEVSQEEKNELEKVETLKKSDKQREDSVLALWQKKMDESKVGKK